MNDTQNRIIDTPDDVYFSPVDVTEGSDWSDAEEADNDLRTALGFSIGSANRAVYYHFWEGEDDVDDFACMRIQKSGTATWADFFNSACDFETTPNEGSTVFMLCGIVKNA